MSTWTPLIEGYVYSMWSGKFLGKPARIVHQDHRSIAVFKDDKYVVVNKMPGQMYNAIVWLEERDDAVAASLLIEHEMKQIGLLHDKIENHEYRIKLLKANIAEVL